MEAREVGEIVKISADSTSRKVSNRLPINAAASLVNQETQHLPRSCRCAYCNDSHYSASCLKVVDINTRKQILKRDHRCFICLSKGHIAGKCDPGRSCRRCNGRHHQSICTASKTPPHSHKPPQRTSNESQDQETSDSAGPSNQTQGSTQDTSGVNTTTTVSKERRSVLLQTAITTVQSSNGSKSVTARLLFDSGSQRSYITSSLKAKLGLVPVKRETLNLNTFGDK